MARKLVGLLLLLSFSGVPMCEAQIEDANLYEVTKQSLRDNEILIETQCSIGLSGQVEYMVHTVKKGNVSPRTFHLFKESDLENALNKGEALYTGMAVAQLLLKPLQKELDGVKRIFFKPSGKLRQFAIEYCNVGDGKMLAEKYEFYRLTSSAVLTQRQSRRKPYTSYIIFGGIDFDRLPDFEEKYQRGATNSRYGYLQDSYEAAKDIHHYMTEMGLHGMLFANDEATETIFKTLPWQDVQVFFIETHGIADPRKGNCPYPNALMLAGASYLMEGGIMPEGKEDGLLTIEEIASQDMSNVDLAVISACKSALGEFDNQRVDGLMRAFKAAGVKSLVMTTDDVVDYVSGEVWKLFFRNIANGMSKRESLLDALKRVQTIHDGFYSSPKFWAPFILIDGLD